VAGCAATGAKIPGCSASEARNAAAMTGVETGRRPSLASRADPRSSASRYGVRKLMAAMPIPRLASGPRAPEPKRRRVATPTWFEGTMIDTGANGSSPFAAATVLRSAPAASRPYRTNSIRMAIGWIVGGRSVTSLLTQARRRAGAHRTRRCRLSCRAAGEFRAHHGHSDPGSRLLAF